MTGANTITKKDFADKYIKQPQAKCVREAQTETAKRNLCARRKIDELKDNMAIDKEYEL